MDKRMKHMRNVSEETVQERCRGTDETEASDDEGCYREKEKSHDEEARTSAKQLQMKTAQLEETSKGRCRQDATKT